MNRIKIAQAVNDAGASVGRGFPKLVEGSSRETLIAWLAHNDPSGIYTDEDLRAEGEEPMTLDEAWKQVAEGCDYSEAPPEPKRALAWARFTKGDWAGFSGAEKFPNGDEPLSAELSVDGRPAVAVCDLTGLGLYVEGEDSREGQDGDAYWSFFAEYRTGEQKLQYALNAMFALASVMTSDELRKLGFTKDGER